MKNLLVLSLAALAACAMPAGDSGNGTDTATGTSTGTGTGSTSTTDSCEWDGYEICAQFTDYADTQAWCSAMGTKYADDGITTEYNNASCASGAFGTCTIPGSVSGDDYDADAVVYYYAPISPTDAQAACTDAYGAYATL
ncbi:MAG: hypothetical protein RLZZ299_415 [Pseudomonadota bacterium]|jgi:hypothetical protein